MAEFVEARVEEMEEVPKEVPLVQETVTEGETEAVETHGSTRAKSDVWNHFVINGSKTAMCLLCLKDFAYHGGSSNLRDHLLRFHSEEFNKSKKQKQPFFDSFVIHLWLVLNAPRVVPMLSLL